MAENLNISPEIINDLVNMLKNNGFSDNSNSSNQNEQNINNSGANQYTQYSTDANMNQYEQTETNSSTNIDFETIMKMKSMMDTLNNSNNQDSKLLYSLKPYLRKSRQAKLDQYINILKITQVSKLFNSKSEKS